MKKRLRIPTKIIWNGYETSPTYIVVLNTNQVFRKDAAELRAESQQVKAVTEKQHITTFQTNKKCR